MGFSVIIDENIKKYLKRIDKEFSTSNLVYKTKIIPNKNILICENTYENNKESTYENSKLENHNSIILINGTITNHNSLRSKLPNYKWKGNSQEESINQLIFSFGIGFILPELEGNFSIVFIDLKRNIINIVSDNFRSKEIFFYSNKDENKFIISTDITHIRRFFNNENFEIDEMSKAQYFTFGYPIKPRTIYKKIKSIKRHEILQYNFKDRIFISLPRPSFQGVVNNDSFEEILLRNIERAIKYNNSFPILSTENNIDLLILIILEKVFGIKGYGLIDNTFNKNHSKISEFNKQNIRYNEFQVEDGSDLYHLITNINDITEQPFANIKQLSDYKIYELFKKNSISSFFNTIGYDEIFFGYAKYFNAIQQNKLSYDFKEDDRYKKYIKFERFTLEMQEYLKTYNHILLQNETGNININKKSIMEYDRNSNLISNLLLINNRNSYFHNLESYNLMLNNSILNFSNYYYSGQPLKKLSHHINPINELFLKYNITNRNRLNTSKNLSDIPFFISKNKILKNYLLKEFCSSIDLLPKYYKYKYRKLEKLGKLNDYQFNSIFQDLWTGYCWIAFIRNQ